MNGFENAPQRILWGMPAPAPPKFLDYRTTYMTKAHRPESLLDYANLYLADVEYDTLVGTGLSGTIAVLELARQLGKDFLIVRKPGENSHTSSPAEGILRKRWVFVDDLVDSGATFCRVWDRLDQIRENRSFDTEYVGAFLYNSPCFIGADHSETELWLKEGGSKRWKRPSVIEPRLPDTWRWWDSMLSLASSSA